MIRNDIEHVIRQFTDKTDPTDRYTSFDYCYNYFYSTNDLTSEIEKSCLVLGFYLASWGMFRGSSFLMQKSIKYFQPTIEYISTLNKSIRNLDVDNYSKDNTQAIIEVYSKIKEFLIVSGNSDLTLITKILLGVFGFIPAYDQYFTNTFIEIFKESRCGFRRVNYNSLSCIREFYEYNKEAIDKMSESTFTTDFHTGEKTNITYPKAKIIDMYGFTLGLGYY